MGQFYEIEVYFKVNGKKQHKVKFCDSLKIIPFSVDETAKYFGLPISKLKINYNEYRELGHLLTDEEKEYIKNDVLIMSKALKTIFDEGLTRMTRAGNALADFKRIITNKKFKEYFPLLPYEVDESIRRSYKGGFTFVNPANQDKEIKENICVLDVNSLYPWVMYEKDLPIGEPIYFEGKYEEDNNYPLYIQSLTCSFELKKNHIPIIQIKRKNMYFLENEYIESSQGECFELTLTSIDLKLFFEHYDVKNITYHDGWKFKKCNFLFKEYIDKWISRKIEAGKSGNKGQRQLAKLMLNSLYGKFAKSMKMRCKIPIVTEDIVHYMYSDEELVDGIYIPVASFITAYAREKTIRTSQKIKEYSLKKYNIDKYIYSDTDSIHTTLSIEELKQFCEIDDFKLGYWANEYNAERGIYLRQKCYLDVVDGEIKITCSGMPKKCVYHKSKEDKKLYYRDDIGIEHVFKFNDFKIGFTCGGKLTFKHLKGGVKLIEETFTIKEQKLLKSIEKFT